MAPCGILDLHFGIFPNVDVQGWGIPLSSVTAWLHMAAKVALKADATDLRLAPRGAVSPPVRCAAKRPSSVYVRLFGRPSLLSHFAFLTNHRIPGIVSFGTLRMCEPPSWV